MKKFSNILDFILGYENISAANNAVCISWNNILSEVFSENDGISKEIIKNIAENSKISEIDERKIVIEVNHNGWIQILSTKRQNIVSVMQKKYNKPNLNKILFVLSRK
jgi:hypothetical protein